jgi:hypothetical protein
MRKPSPGLALDELMGRLLDEDGEPVSARAAALGRRRSIHNRDNDH